MISRPSTIVHSQAAAFFPSGAAPNATQLLRRIPEEWFKHYSGEPIILPRPQGTPREVPALILQNHLGTEQIVVSHARIDVVCTTQLTNEKGSKGFFTSAGDRIIDIAKFSETRVGRIAAILHRIVEVPQPALALARHFCKEKWITDGPLNRPENFELHAHKTFTTQFGVIVNSWVRNKSATLATGTTIVHVEQDMNTHQEVQETKDFGPSEVRTFFTQITNELDRTLALYYPEAKDH